MLWPRQMARTMTLQLSSSKCIEEVETFEFQSMCSNYLPHGMDCAADALYRSESRFTGDVLIADF